MALYTYYAIIVTIITKIFKSLYIPAIDAFFGIIGENIKYFKEKVMLYFDFSSYACHKNIICCSYY